MATIKKVKKAQGGASMFLKGLKKTTTDKKFPSGDLLPSSPDYAGPKQAPAKISGPEKQMKMAQKERAKKAAAKKAAASSPVRPLKMGGKVKKAQAGMTMKQLIKKYPGTDTTAKGDVRGSEMNSGAPKKVLDKYNDTYNAFDRKSKEAPVKAKPAKKSMKTGGKMSKMSKKK